MTPQISYRGRFAPSPTGPLHFGSLVAALGSYLQARHHHGEWLVRIEDIDPPRQVAGAADDILRTLERLGLEWDGPVTYQSTRLARYQAALERLAALDALYPCHCSRRAIAAHGRPGSDGWIYPGTCRNRPRNRKGASALRVRTHNEPIEFEDGIQGVQRQRLEASNGDFVVQRADGLIAYQLAVVVDDAEQGISEVVRGSDLLNSTAKQIHLQRLLGYVTPGYLHLPVANNARGEKLSKQTGAAPLLPGSETPALIAALAFLGQAVDTEWHHARPDEILKWAVPRWEVAAIPNRLGAVWPPP